MKRRGKDIGRGGQVTLVHLPEVGVKGNTIFRSRI